MSKVRQHYGLATTGKPTQEVDAKAAPAARKAPAKATPPPKGKR